MEEIKKYHAIFADPAWKYKGKNMNGSIERDSMAVYTTSSFRDMSEMAMPYAADDCVLWMWGTFPQLEKCVSLLEAWGFRYEGFDAVWYKWCTKSKRRAWGTGSYARSNVEFIMLGTRGVYTGKLKPLSLRLTAHRRKEHSRKPVEAYEFVLIRAKEFGLGTPLEMFCRGACPGFDESASHESGRYASADVFMPLGAATQGGGSHTVSTLHKPSFSGLERYPPPTVRMPPFRTTPFDFPKRKFSAMVLRMTGPHQFETLPNPLPLHANGLIIFKFTPENVTTWIAVLGRRKHVYKTLFAFLYDRGFHGRHEWWGVATTNKRTSILKLKRAIGEEYDTKTKKMKPVHKHVSQVIRARKWECEETRTRDVLGRLFNLIGKVSVLSVSMNCRNDSILKEYF